MAETASFSVITVTFNNLDGLRKTRASLKSQTCRDFQWIVVDGGSSDGTAEWLPHTDSEWVSETDHGIYDAMNKGIARAAGQYLLFLNAGDMLPAPDTLEKLRAEIRANAPDFLYGDSHEYLQNGQTVYKPARPHHKRRLGMFTHHQAMLYRREALADMRYDLSYKIAGDYDLTCRFLQKANTVLYISAPLCIFESGGVSQQKATLGRSEQFRIRRKLHIGGWPFNAALYALQSLAWKLRTLFPHLYWSLKSKRRPA